MWITLNKKEAALMRQPLLFYNYLNNFCKFKIINCWDEHTFFWGR